jgi:hypothetical protein
MKCFFILLEYSVKKCRMASRRESPTSSPAPGKYTTASIIYISQTIIHQRNQNKTKLFLKIKAIRLNRQRLRVCPLLKLLSTVYQRGWPTDKFYLLFDVI